MTQPQLSYQYVQFELPKRWLMVLRNHAQRAQRNQSTRVRHLLQIGLESSQDTGGMVWVRRTLRGGIPY